MRFRCEIDMDNAAFEEMGGRNELYTLLRVVAGKVLSDRTDGPLVDINGNTVGHWSIEETNEGGDDG